MLDQHPFDEQRIHRFQFRPLDMRYAYIETGVKLWNESRSLLVAAAEAEAGFLLARRRAPRALDGAALHFSGCLVDQKVLFTDAYAIPFWLSARSEETNPRIPLRCSISTPSKKPGRGGQIFPIRPWPTCSSSVSATQRPTRTAQR